MKCAFILITVVLVALSIWTAPPYFRCMNGKGWFNPTAKTVCAYQSFRSAFS